MLKRFERYIFVILSKTYSMPGVRGLLSVAADLGGLCALPALGVAAVAAVAWSELLLGRGCGSLGALVGVVARYNAPVGGTVVLALITTTVRAWRRAGPQQEPSWGIGTATRPIMS
ncbi:MAG TPA: hypothetical protein ENK18_09610 [Deltaproteobacteria bacterium]|nr:hypothetical protein [Deltaproteobacteria bacterium]